MREELLGVQLAIARMLAQLPKDLPALPYVVDEKRQPRSSLQFLEEKTTPTPARPGCR